LGGGDVPVTNAALDVLGVGVTQQETTIAVRQVGPTTTVCVGFRDFGNNARINGFGYSLNGGTSFIDGGSLPVGPFADPSLVVDSAGDFLYGSLRGGLQQLDLHTSTNCQGFSYAELIANVPGASGQFTVDKPFLTHDSYPGSPNFGRTWAAYDRLVSPVGVWVAYSDDAGDDAPEWVAQEQVPGAGSHPWPAVAPNGDLYVAGIGGTAVGIAHRSTLGVWTAKAPVTTTAAFSGDATATFDCGRRSLKGRMRSEPLPQIAIHPDASAPAGFVIHAVWQADPDGSGAGTDVSDVYYSRSIDGATTWSAPMRVNDDPVGSARDQWNPALAVSPSGLVAISWYDRRLDPNNWYFDRYLRISDNGGLRWSKNLRISDVSSPVARMIAHVDGLSSSARNCDHGDYDQVAIAGNTVHLAWSDARDVQTLPPL
jgi:hypothetical protein